MWVAAVFAIACVLRDAGAAAPTNQSELEPQLLLLANTPTTCSWGANLACSLTDSTNNLKLGDNCVLPVPIPTDNYVSDKRTNKFDDAQLLTASEQPFIEITSTLAGQTTVDSTTGKVAWFHYKTAPLTSQQSVNFKVAGLYSLSIIATDYDRTAQCDGCVAINDAYRPRFKTGSCPTAPFTKNENILIRSRRDPSMCVDDGGGTTPGQTKFTLVACNPNSANQVYTYDPSNMRFKNVNKNNLCLDDGGGYGLHSTPAHLWTCDVTNWNQHFTYSAQTGQIKNPHKNCFTDFLQSGTTHWFYYAGCDASALDQQFDLVPQWQLLNVPNPAALTTASLATARTYEGSFDNFVKDANVLNNANSGDDCSTTETKVEYLRDDLKALSSGSCFSDASLATSVANLKTSPFTDRLQTPYASLQTILADSCQWCCEKSRTLLEKYTKYACAAAPEDMGCVGGSGNSCSMNLCLKVFGDTLATVTIGIASAVQTVSTGVLNALPSTPTGSDATKHVYYSVGCTDFSATDSKCHYDVELSKLLTVTTGFAGSFPTPASETGKINDYVFWRYNLDGGEWKTWNRASDSKIAFIDASTTVIVEAWTSCGRVGSAFSFDVNLFVHSTLTCSSFDAMWKLEGSSPTPGNAYCAYPGSDFAVMKLDMTVADVVPSSAGKVTGSYAGVTCDIMLKEEATSATNTKAYQLLSDSTNPTISKYFAVEMVHNPHTARKTAAKVTCKFTRTPHSNTVLMAEDTDPNSITCMHDFTVTDCDAPAMLSFAPDGVCADKCAGKAAPGVNEACGGTVVRSDATDTSISTTEATCCTDCDPDLTCTAIGTTDVKRCEKSPLTPMMLAATEEEKSLASSSTLALLGATAMVAVVALVVVKRRTANSIVHEDAYYPLLE